MEKDKIYWENRPGAKQHSGRERRKGRGRVGKQGSSEGGKEDVNVLTANDLLTKGDSSTVQEGKKLSAIMQ